MAFVRISTLALAAWLPTTMQAFDESTSPVWPPSVKVFSPEDSADSIESAVNAAFAVNGGQINHGQFSEKRFAFLFKPGQYNVDVPVGYYTHVAGLGKSPSEVVFTSPRGVYCEEGDFSVTGGALSTFWRMAENFQTNANFSWNNNPGMLWAVSQAAPLRSVIVTGGLNLYQYTGGGAAGYASGGYMANVQVKQATASGSQQQFLTRNSDISGWNEGVWNMVFVGTTGAPAGHCGLSTGKEAYVTIDKTPTIAEKPFISINPEGEYFLNVPPSRTNRAGVDYTGQGNTQYSFSGVFVADADRDSAETINAKLAEGKHVVFSPGIYNLDAPLMILNENQVLLGLGLATLVSSNGNAVIKVGNVGGVRVAGLLLQAGHQPTDVLLEWGQGTYAGDASNPGHLHDLFARVGGPDNIVENPQAKVMVVINSGHVIGDNLWLWRADHFAGGYRTVGGRFPCDTALIVNGDDVTMYALAAEHALQDLVQWNGERGATYFYQSELPYDVNKTYGDEGFVGYRVADHVNEHAGYGVGVYHFFRDHQVTVKSGIACPAHLEGAFVDSLSVYLNGFGVMQHILNDKGSATSHLAGKEGAHTEWLCTNPGPQPGPSPPTPAPPTPTPPTPTPPTPPRPGKACKVGEAVHCPGVTAKCAGNQCCQDGSTCPSADNSFKGCPHSKRVDCTTPTDVLVV